MAENRNEKIENSEAAKNTSIGSFDSVADFTKHGLAEIVEATKAVNNFPTGTSRDLYCSYAAFGRVIDRESDRILGLISKVLKRQNIKGNIQRRQPDEQFEMLLECNDGMLERLGSNLDQFAGIKKKLELVVVESQLQVVRPAATEVGAGAGSWNKKTPEITTMRLTTAHNIPRPQTKYQMQVDNNAQTPFVPRLKEKPNSIKPLAILPEYDADGNIVSYLHPYEFELMRFEVPETFLKRKALGDLPRPLAETPYLYVDNVANLQTALEELRGHAEIAVDVENHSYRSFQGFTCLVQISTRQKDYLFDALALREDMHILNEIFTDPKVVKILHGADLDVEWLQRDLSLYIVNLFDTHQAAKLLQYPRLSLAYLLQHYCNIEADKTYQLADWRMRPLPDDFIAYARQDTHFLIYIYERLTNDLLDTSQPNILRSVYQSGSQICSKRYKKPKLSEDSHLDVFRKSKRVFDNRQLFALEKIFKWRDVVARQEDESYGYVIPNHMMLQIAESLPREMQGILACCNPVPPLVRQNLHILHQFILRAREQPLVKPILEKDPINRVARSSNKDYNNPLHCPHDLSYCAEFRDDLPTLMNQEELQDKQESNLLREPILSAFASTYNAEERQRTRQMMGLENITPNLTPYERYLAVLPEIEKEKLAEAARIEEENKKRALCPDEPQKEITVKKEKLIKQYIFKPEK